MTVYTMKRTFQIPLRYYDIRNAGPTLVNNITNKKIIEPNQDKQKRNIQYGLFIKQTKAPFPFG